MAGGRIELHRRVILFGGQVAIVVAVVCLAVVVGGPGPGIGLLAAAAALIPYLLISGASQAPAGADRTSTAMDAMAV